MRRTLETVDGRRFLTVLAPHAVCSSTISSSQTFDGFHCAPTKRAKISSQSEPSILAESPLDAKRYTVSLPRSSAKRFGNSFSGYGGLYFSTVLSLGDLLIFGGLFKYSQLSIYCQFVRFVCLCSLMEVTGFKNIFKHSLRDWDRKAIACLLSGLAVITYDFKRLWETLQTQHFSGCKATFSIYKQIVVRGTGAKCARVWICTNVSSFVFMPDSRFRCRLSFAQTFISYVFRSVIMIWNIGFKNFTQRFHRYFLIWPIKANRIAKPYYENSFSFLW